MEELRKRLRDLAQKLLSLKGSGDEFSDKMRDLEKQLAKQIDSNDVVSHSQNKNSPVSE